MEIPIKQNTGEWLLLRRGPKKIRVGGSEVGIICGVSKSVLPHSLYEKIVGELNGTWIEDRAETPDACAHGHLCEPIIANLYEKLTGNIVEEANYWQHENETMAIMFGCSPDRKVFVNDEFEGILEIKAPYYIMYDEIKPEHMCQVQYQMWITKKPWCDYMAVKLPHDNPESCTTPEILLKRVYYSPKYVEEFMKPRLFYFIKCLITQTIPTSDYYHCEYIPIPRMVDVI